MKAVIFEEFGEPAVVLTCRDAEVPTPAAGELRIRMLVSPVNPSDLMTVRGTYGRRPELPATPGYEGVGIVEAAGRGFLGRLLTGKRVAVLNRATGNWCEQTVIPAKQAIPIPSNLPHEQAAMFFVNPATAYIMTRKILKPSQGEWLLQSAAGSAVGRMVVRLGKRFGFRTLNIVRRDQQIDELKSLGADAVIPFNPAHDEPAALNAEVRSLTDGRGVKFAVDPVGGAVGSAIVECLAARGKLLAFGSLSEASLSFPPRSLIASSASLEGFWLTNYMDSLKLPAKLLLVRRIGKLIREGVLTTGVGTRFGLQNIRDAVREAETVGRRGKVILEIN